MTKHEQKLETQMVSNLYTDVIAMKSYNMGIELNKLIIDGKVTSIRDVKEFMRKNGKDNYPDTRASCWFLGNNETQKNSLKLHEENKNANKKSLQTNISNCDDDSLKSMISNLKSLTEVLERESIKRETVKNLDSATILQ